MCKTERSATLLYYKYVSVADAAIAVTRQRELCTNLDLTGRIRVAREGINGTLGGSLLALESYINAMNADLDFPFQNIDYKWGDGGKDSFPGLHVRECEEIVTLGISPSVISAIDAAPHLSPSDFLAAIQRRHPESTLLLDVRNDYESKIGLFENAHCPSIRSFCDLPAYLSRHQHLYVSKDVYMYCTGGVRCERASVLVKSLGASSVYQLEGGIHRFLETFPDGGGAFLGRNLVFDERTSVRGTLVSDAATIIGRCDMCNSSFDDYSADHRCLYCRARLLVCDACEPNRPPPHLCCACAIATYQHRLKKPHVLRGRCLQVPYGALADCGGQSQLFQ